MKKFAIYALISILAFPIVTLGQSRIQRLSFYSPSVSDTMHVVVLLPTHYDSARAYPVLFLLHGYGGDQNNWTDLTDLVSYTTDIPLIVVMPEAENSWYVNSVTNPKAKFENYIMNDLPRYVGSHFLIDTTREAIAGLSMGGYGALVLALRRPHKFLFAGDLSGAITIPQIIDSVHDDPHFVVGKAQESIMPSIISAFGDHDKQFRDSHNVFVLLSRDSASSIPYIFMAAGIQDQFREFLPTDHQFIDSLRAHGVRYEYHEMPGEHNWKFWNEELNPMLERMEVVMDLVHP